MTSKRLWNKGGNSATKKTKAKRLKRVKAVFLKISKINKTLRETENKKSFWQIQKYRKNVERKWEIARAKNRFTKKK